MKSTGRRSELSDLLPLVEERPILGDATAGFSYVDAPDDAYVAPQLRQAPTGSANPSLVLVEARAAVGKSMLAQHLAWATRGILWDLSETFVGTGTLWGSLARAFGPMELNNIIGRTATGQFVVLLDALDEAEMHAEGPAFDAFLVDLRDMFAAPRPMPGAVILGRTETIDYIELFLAESVPLVRYEILDFDRALAYEFVDRRLDMGRVSNPDFSAGLHRKHEKLYQNARERLFDFLIDRLIPDIERPETIQPGHEWPIRVSSFLGYAPVLEAVAEFLASYSLNYPALISDIGQMKLDPYHSGIAQWSLLRNIVTRLLRREQDKVVAQVRKVIPELTSIDWADVYRPDEQCARVLGRVSGSTAVQEIDRIIPEEFSSRYQEVLKNALPNHPFLGTFFGYANVVFRDFIHAWGLRSQSQAVIGAVRVDLRSNDYLPSPLLGPFVLAESENGDVPNIEGEDVGFVYESLLTHGETDLYIFAESGEPGNVFIGSDPAAEVAVFSLRNESSPIAFWRRLVRAQIKGGPIVRLGLPERSFSLGPSVNIECEMLEVPCRAIRVFTNDPSGGVVLSASVGYDSGSIEPELSKFGSGTLAVSWDSIRYPWADYGAVPVFNDIDKPLWDDPRLQESFVALCRIAQRFATSVRHVRPFYGPTAFGTAFFGRSYAATRRDSPGGEAVLSWLISNGIVFNYARRGYFLLDSRLLLDEFGIRVFELCARSKTQNALLMMQRYLEDTKT